MPITYNNLYLDIRQELRRAGIEGATLEARELVCYGSGKTRQELIRDGQLYVAPEMEKAIRQLVERHLNGEPVAYLIGEWEFYGMPLDISEAVLIPRVDTEVLASQAIGYVKALGPCRVLDLCAGSGCVGLAVGGNFRGGSADLPAEHPPQPAQRPGVRDGDGCHGKAACGHRRVRLHCL